VFVVVFAVLFVEFLLIKNTSFVDLTLIPASLLTSKTVC